MILRSYKDPATFRVVRFQDSNGETFYGCAHPGHPIPHGVDYLADCATLADARAYAAQQQESDEALERMPAVR